MRVLPPRRASMMLGTVTSKKTSAKQIVRLTRRCASWPLQQRLAKRTENEVQIVSYEVKLKVVLGSVFGGMLGE